MEPVSAVIIVVIAAVVLIVLGYAATKAYCTYVKNKYTSNPAAAAAVYGFPTFAAWLAAQNGWVRWVC
jgi:hypothetical protein